ncbi:MAG: cytochrome c biogenesis protein ResB [Gemmataceae bacterium]
MACARVAFYKKGTDEKLKELFLSFWYYPNAVNRLLHFPPQTLTVGDKTYEVELRPRREYKDYTIKLRQFTHEKFQGTSTAKNFQSLIDFTGPDGQRREVKIYMNNPMRYAGETFYQSGYFPDNTGTILQVVRNPAWLMPYLSCTMVTLGLLIHFGMNLISFLQRRAVS